MNAAIAPDRQKIISLIAERNGIRVEKDDPVFAVATICQAYLEEAGRQIEASIRERLAEFEAAVGKVQARAGQLVAAEFNDRVASIRSELQQDIVLAGAKANEIVFRAEQANRQPVILRWATLGIVAALALFLIGLWIGARYMHL
jgi:hypothetical protein